MVDLGEVQIVWRRRPRDKIYIRAKPVTTKMPKDAQIERRLAFARAASLARGKRGLAPDGLPWAAHHVKEMLKGTKAPEEIKYKKEPEWLKRIEDLKNALTLVIALSRPAPEAYRPAPAKSYT